MARLLISPLRSYLNGVKKAMALKPIDFSEKMMLWDMKHEESVNQWECISDEEKGGHSKATFKSNKKGIIYFCNKITFITLSDAYTCFYVAQKF